MNLPVVIVSYNTRDLLRDCLRSLLASEGVNPQAIVVDNASQDGSAEMVRREFPQARLLAQEQNLGFAAANNAALRALGFDGQSAGSPLPDCVILLNPDTTVAADSLVTLVNFLRAHPRAGAVGAQLVYPDGRRQHSAFRFPGVMQTFLDFFPLHHRLLDSPLNGRYPPRRAPFAIDHPLGACILARGEAIRQIGLMDEGYFMYVEEVDWCRRIRRAGWQIFCEPRAVIVHHEAQSTRQFREAMVEQLWRSRLRYFRKHHSPAYVGLIRAIVRLGLWNERRKTLREPSLSADDKARRLAAFARVQALWERKEA